MAEVERMKLYLADISNDIIICTKDYLIDLLERSDDVVSAKRMDNLAEITDKYKSKKIYGLWGCRLIPIFKL